MAGVLGALALSNSSSVLPETTTTETTVQLIAADVPPPPPCTLVTANGSQIANACTQQIASWTAGFRNGLGTAAYYPKWKAANPGEYQTLQTYAVSAPSTPQPRAQSGFGAIVRWGIEQCRIWASNVASCTIP